MKNLISVYSVVLLPAGSYFQMTPDANPEIYLHKTLLECAIFMNRHALHYKTQCFNASILDVLFKIKLGTYFARAQILHC
jgi:hypothetical protein